MRLANADSAETEGAHRKLTPYLSYGFREGPPQWRAQDENLPRHKGLDRTRTAQVPYPPLADWGHLAGHAAAPRSPLEHVPVATLRDVSPSGAQHGFLW